MTTPKKPRTPRTRPTAPPFLPAPDPSTNVWDDPQVRARMAVAAQHSPQPVPTSVDLRPAIDTVLHQEPPIDYDTGAPPVPDDEGRGLVTWVVLAILAAALAMIIFGG
jgi:hypothetical protein